MPHSDLSALVAASNRKLVVIDDDPTGTQTVHGFDVLTEWSESSLASALCDPRPCFFILTNSRSLPEPEAIAVSQTLIANLHAASLATRQNYAVISRSDSTLRGHFPAEVDTLASAKIGGYDGIIVAPAFFEAGRLTIGDVHYVREGERLVPASDTEFARDATFGYRSSNLRDWIEEKTCGRVGAGAVASVSLDLLRQPNGVDRVRERLMQLSGGAYLVVNAEDYRDLEVFVQGLLQAEAARRSFLCRTAASFVRVRAGLGPKPVLAAAAVRGTGSAGGLVMVGSYTAKTTAQLTAALALPRAVPFELKVDKLGEPGGAAAEVTRLAVGVDAAVGQGCTAVVFTSRERNTRLGRAGDLASGRVVSDALVTLIQSLAVRPRFLVAKGGITSSDLAVRGMGVRRALIEGQAAAGLPVWRTGPESRWPGLAYVVFPGNVGDNETLRTLLEQLQ